MHPGNFLWPLERVLVLTSTVSPQGLCYQAPIKTAGPSGAGGKPTSVGTRLRRRLPCQKSFEMRSLDFMSGSITLFLYWQTLGG